LPGDVFNPNVWTVTNLETNATFIVLAIRDNDPPLEFDITVLEPFASFQVQHRVQSTTLVDESGSPIDTPNFADFAGVLDIGKSDPSQIAATRGVNVRDLRNLPAPMTGISGGTLIINSDGDYELESGPALVRKLIIRRLVTTPGGFFHLPNYGVGLKVKEPLPGGDIPKLRAEIERQIKLEPEVEAVQAIVRQALNLLTIEIRAKLKPTGQVIEFPLEIPLGGVQL
jgi:hypothetical protein